MEKLEDSPAEAAASPWDSSSSQYPLGAYCSVHLCNRTLLCCVATVLTYFCATDSQSHEGMKESHRWSRHSVRLGAIEIAKHRPYPFASFGKRLEFASPVLRSRPAISWVPGCTPVFPPLALSIDAASYTFV
ncbi:hypothetical protein P170DRAFT_447693 [Aspergillus steynii IBT 23096]|uniref:Uncharacterized protein n=1 Tax=Aspergillus steynii IBT 23096 TaxID=1392250 RepID=A0A2I2G4J7_9EURO|nr:uncharacterized protein P170DRAFT_447693 [Aspergillus steynii IBT 23096]PLB47802.1 hypothetical protein P170DRAFT_447693 [Aspergillus steynii IBT 23096]